MKHFPILIIQLCFNTISLKVAQYTWRNMDAQKNKYIYTYTYILAGYVLITTNTEITYIIMQAGVHLVLC